MTWNSRQRRMWLLLGVAIVACWLAVVRPQVAHAGYPLSSAARVALGFGDTYRSAEATSSSTHRGTDLSAEAGEHVLAPFSGHVTFAGRVPAVGGGTVRAVTLQTSQGAVTLLPLSNVSVAQGADVDEGDSVGTLAESGDGSSAGAHLHVGIKRGDLYVDPMSLLTLPAVAPNGDGEGAASGASAKAGSAASAAAATGSHAAAPAGVSASGERAGVSAGSGSAESAGVGAAAHAPLRAAVPGVQLAPGVSIAGGAVGAQAGAALAAQDARAAGLGGTASSTRGVGSLASAASGSALTVRELAARIARLVASGALTLGIVALAVMAGLGLLWPLWRRQDQKGTGEDRVSVTGQDVAAVVGR